MAAFVLLIISSATATIFIGNTVFSRKVAQIAESKIDADLRSAYSVFETRTDRIRLLAQSIAFRSDAGQLRENLKKDIVRETLLDVVLIFSGPQVDLLRFSEARTQSAPPDPAAINLRSLSSDQARLLWTSDLARLGQQAQQQDRALSGTVLLSRDVLTLLGYTDPPAQGMLLLGAAPLADGFMVMVTLFNGNRFVTGILQDLASTLGKDSYVVTIFQDDVRIATTFGEAALGTRADPAVADTVLKQGARHIGAVTLLGAGIYAAYRPIRTLDGRIVGMLGIGTKEDVYGAVVRSTTTLFTSLIAGGMIFGFIMSWLFAAWLIKPLNRLAEGMAKVASGDLTHKVRITSPEELAALANSFNTMVRTVKERDIKLREMTDERLSRVEKEVSIGRLAAGVAHEINNPLTAVLSLSSLMAEQLPPDDPKREDLDIIVEETNRCRDIVRSLLDFARERPSQKRRVDINQVVKDTLKLTTKYYAVEKVNTTLELFPSPLFVHADPKQLMQVVTNIILNAAEATEDGGLLNIRTEEDSSGGYVHILVKDQGKGIPKEHLDRIFEPFFTTKGAKKGTGLGLSVSLGIVKKHDGTIEIDSVVGVGTTVTVVLPLASAEEPPPEDEEADNER